MSNENSKMILGKTLEEASTIVKNQEIIQEGKAKTFIFNTVTFECIGSVSAHKNYNKSYVRFFLVFFYFSLAYVQTGTL